MKILKFTDGLVGSFLAALLPRPRYRAMPVKRVLLVRPGGIGDAALLVPLINHIQQSFDDVEITVLAEKRNQGVFALCSGVARVVCYDTPGQLARLLFQQFDVVIDSEQWHRLSAVIVRLVRSGMKIGFATNNRKRMFTHGIEYSHSEYELNQFMRLGTPLGISDTTNEGAFLHVSEGAMSRAGALLGENRGAYAVLFPGASIPERQWGGRKFRSIARYIADAGLRVVVVGGAQDGPAGEMIIAGMNGGLNLAGRCTLEESAAVIAQGVFLVSGDSGILHIAVGLKVPTVSLFGPGIADKWAPRGDLHRVLNRALDCSPCTRFGYTPRCPIGVKCLQDISEAEIKDAIQVLLSTELGL